MTTHPEIPCKERHPPESRPARGAAFDPALMCKLCWLFVNDERYHALWTGRPIPGRTAAPPAPAGKAAPPRKALPSRPACRHLGAPTGETRECHSCTRQQAPVRACGPHGQCVERVLIAGLACCKVCDDYSPPEATP